MVPFTVSVSSGLLKSDSASRETLSSFSAGVGGLGLDDKATLQVPSGVSGQAISLTAIGGTANVLFLRSSVDVLLSINGATTPFTLKGGGFFLSVGCAITALAVSNSSGNTAVIEMYAAGAAS